MRELFTLMAEQHGVASCAQARRIGLSAKAEATRVANGTLASPFPGVLTAAGAPVTFEGRAMAAALSPGVVAVSHGGAARVHGLDGFEDTETVDVLGRRGAHLHPSLGVAVHYTRAALDDHVTRVGPIPVLSVAATLALLAPAFGISRTARALDSALRLGVPSEELRRVAVQWRRRGRSGPPALMMLLGERVDQRLPRSWFQWLASRVVMSAGVRLVDQYPVRDARGNLLAELDLADPARKVGVEGQSWQCHASPTAQHQDARRRGVLRQLSWEIVDVWWSDLHHPERVVAEITYLLRSRGARPSRPA